MIIIQSDKSKRDEYGSPTRVTTAAESSMEYTASLENKSLLPKKAMEKAAKELDFIEAARLRDNFCLSYRLNSPYAVILLMNAVRSFSSFNPNFFSDGTLSCGHF